MKRILNRIRRLFLRTPEGAQARRRALPFVGIALFIFIVLVTIPPVWEYSNSTTFCGETCHTMPPALQTYQTSPHARVPCVDCHIGRGLIIQQAYRKTAHMHLLTDTLTGNYEYPIHVSTMRPARQTCELCHFPEKFSDDSLRMVSRFQRNETNDPYDLYLLMHTGGGSTREGLGFGIHWHVENPLEFIATDDLQQDIPWVRVHNPDGSTTEYQTEDAAIDSANLEQYELFEMDCDVCHNRISHHIDTPGVLVDSAMQQGDLPTTIPNIRAVAEDLLNYSYESTEEAASEIPAQLASIYQEQYPDFYAANTPVLDAAGETLQTIWTANNFPEQKLNWATHPNNIGHQDWPGCFRCHDGRHTNDQGEAIRLECNLCHSIPQIVKPDDIEPMLPLTTGNEPESHLDSTWISRHHNEFDRTCTNCHTVENPGGTSNTSFCSNSACHGAGWEFAGFDAPALALEMGLSQNGAAIDPLADGETLELTYQTFWPLLMISCGRCHDSTPINDLTVTNYESLLAGGQSGPALVPGAPEESLILDVLAAGHFSNLPPEQIALFSQWIADGAPEGGITANAPASYQTLQPILTTACGNCHGGANPERGFDVTTYETLLAGSRGGPVIEPGLPEESLILEVLTEGHFSELSETEMDLLREWISLSMPETDEDAATATPGTTTVAADYATVQAIFNSACISCHGVDDLKAGLDLTTYDGILAGSRHGPIIEPGSPENSYILEVHQEGHPGELTTAQYLIIEQWIAENAPE